jgi:GTP-binding protein
MLEMTPVGSRMKVEFLVPSRGLFGYRNEFMTDTKGEGIMASVFEKYDALQGRYRAPQHRLPHRLPRPATPSPTACTPLRSAAQLFIGAGVPVYGGMVVGQCPKLEDITVNVCRKKQLTNTRAAGSDDALRLIPPKQMSLEQCLEFLADDELLEVTPQNLRLRKSILNHEQRMKWGIPFSREFSLTRKPRNTL